MISVVTPSVREHGCDMVAKCLKRQTFKDFQWIVCAPYVVKEANIFLPEPKKNEGDMYNLNKCWNMMFRACKGELVVSIVDLLWFEPDLLERLWTHYQNNPKSCVGAVGNQYDRIENGKYEHMVWQDPRMRTDQGSFYEINPVDFEMCIASIPRQAILDVGGVDPTFDLYAALSEKEMCLRIDKLGYKFFLDQGIIYRALHHERLTKDWDERYNKGLEYYAKCIHEIGEGTRLCLTNLK